MTLPYLFKLRKGQVNLPLWVGQVDHSPVHQVKHPPTKIILAKAICNSRRFIHMYI